VADTDRKGYLRMNHFHGLRLESEDFEAGERYQVEKRKLHNRMLHGMGVVPRWKGELKVVGRRRGDMSVDINPGYAIDGEGNDVILWEAKILTIDPGTHLPQLPATAHIVLKYVDEPVDFIVNKINVKFKGHKRIHETCRVDVEGKAPDPRDGVELARVLITEDVREITDARDPSSPGPGELDLRYAPRAGSTGSSMGTDLEVLLRGMLEDLRTTLGSFARHGIHSARDVRAAAVTLLMLLETGALDGAEVIKGLKILMDLADEMHQDVDINFPELNGVREWEQWKEIIDALKGIVTEAKPIRGDLENLLKRLSGAVDNLRLAADVKPQPAPPPKPVAAEPEEDEEDEEDEEPEEVAPPEPVKKADAKELSWEELKECSTLPKRIFMDGQNYDLVDQVDIGNRNSEADHEFAIEGAKQDWSTNQNFSYPDGKKQSARGKAHVGGLSKWKMKNLTAGKDIILAKRIDFVRGDIVTRIEIDGTSVGDWSIDGSDRKHRWRNWLFKIPGDSIGSAEVECRQVAVAADRDINMFGLWFYQAID
jgi:hypothetical protein